MAGKYSSNEQNNDKNTIKKKRKKKKEKKETKKKQKKKKKTIKKEKLNKNKKSKKNVVLKVVGILILIIIILVVALFGIAFGYLKDKWGKIKTVDLDETQLGISEEANENLSKYRNIAIFGIDSRRDDYGEGNRSDCIIIASINNETKEVRLISVYRDTYVEIEGYGLDKVTHAYSYGEAELAIKTLNTNLDLNITEFVTVNFDAVADAVDALGGITLNIDSAELKYINDYIDSTSRTTGKKSSYITRTGSQTINGVQAVAYSRIRYTEGGDYKRTERMRTVIEAMVEKLKTKSLTEINKLADEVLPKVYTNVSIETIISMAPDLLNYKITESTGWPYVTQGITLDRWYSVPVTLEENVEKLHQELFDNEDYEVSEKVKEISNKIINKTGYNQ